MDQRDFVPGFPGQSDNLTAGFAPAPDGFDPRYAAARDAAIRSFFNRYGRMPTGSDLEQSVVHFLSPDARAALGAGFGLSSATSGSDATSVAPMMGPPVSTKPVGVSSMPEFSPAYADAAERTVQSFRNRLGRPPTEEEFQQSIGHFLPGGATAMSGEAGLDPTGASFDGGAQSPTASGAGRERDATTDDVSGQVADAGDSAADLPVSIDLGPGVTKELQCKFGKGRYDGWVSVTIQNTPSANFRRNTGDSRPAFLPKPPVSVHFSGYSQTADRRTPRPLDFDLPVDDRAPGRAAYQGLPGGRMEGPGHVYLKAANKGPFAVDVVLGVRTG